MQERPIDKVLERLEDYTERGNEIRARCPAHNGTSEDSLSIREAENRNVLLHCHAECENGDIVEALDLDLADLFSKNGKASKPLSKEARSAKVRTVDELPGLIQAVEAGETLYPLGGSKDVVNAKERLGSTATTSGGAKTWKGEFAEHYRGAKEVVILPDNDEEGAAYAQKVAQDLLGVAEV